MMHGVNEWRQEGRLYLWRYANPKHGWQFSADPVGCRSIRNLLDRMRGGEPCYRTLKLNAVTDTILNVPNYGQKAHGHFEKVRIEYFPTFENLHIEPDGDALILTTDARRAHALSAAVAAVEVGDGDFGISPAKKAASWMFWWMSDINYYDGKRL
ncbi:hypothetical protein [Sphingomonas sp. LT1P40]|uniref:hypothetical protein n=1 Tax=Alteristakelama amylovorans TaxID=3096166 RepID=UPI002FCC6DEA